MQISDYKYVIAGSGFLGSVLAERIASVLKKPVLVLEKRGHIGGNCYSETDPETGIEFHKYGTHIFHTSNERVWNYINQFTSFNQYRHQVLTTHEGKVYQLPINLETINSFFSLSLKPFEVEEFLHQQAAKENISDTSSFEAKAISLVGRQLYEAFIRGYSAKQWQTDPAKLPADLLSRLPFRKNYDENYYFSTYQGVPSNGYTAIFENLLSDPLIDVRLNTDFFDVKDQLAADATIIYSGPLDRYFNYSLGKLNWRTLQFEKQVVGVEDYQGTSVMNFADVAVPYTRQHEPRHLHPERSYTKEKTIVFTEYSKADDGSEPFYPIPNAENIALAKEYRKLVGQEKNLIVAGRLGDYKYYDMHETINRALEIFDDQIKTLHTS
ncbi:UDP-galactopyranose mutase [Lacibacter sediminis]|uniref:UDP-galactopyranose mutase n=1 Tax=Lacibacter sediminis TaxID=2760713 RepID=A0A7G5XEF7_9BACT|nr:UDP-galactopyranose mutase [Lacibacter sediminis]QNA43860.1 UDP-galactopyranose mutase [Lacibacter sediminis]